jgi:hypothetical protein
LRNCNNYQIDLKKATKNKASHGIKEKTILSELSLYHPILNTNIDYMHSILEGVVKRFFRSWFEEKYNNQLPDKSLKESMYAINLRVMNIRPPSFIPNAPRDIFSWNLWKANEFLVFLLYYCLPVFNHIMKANYFAHLTKLVVAMQYLLGENINRNDLDDINDILVDFVKESSLLYGPSIMLSGMHELVHIVQCTIDSGPLNTVNVFMYEENNRGIISFLHGRDLVGDEFLKVFAVAQALHTYVESFVINPKLKKFLKKYVDIRTSNNKLKTNQFDLKLGKLSEPLDNRFKELINKNKLNFKMIKFANTVSIDGISFTDSNNKSRFNDSCVETPMGDIGFIYKIVVTRENKVYFILKRIVKLLDCFYYPPHEKYKSNIILCSVTNEFFICKIANVKKIFFIHINNELNFLSSFNMQHLFH